MKDIEKYIRFCKRFHEYKTPRLKFKELNERYQNLYKKKYNIDEIDINKASFFIFIAIFLISISISLLVTSFNLLIIILYSSILSLVSSYKFNSILCKEIVRNESLLNSILPLIKIEYSLLQKTIEHNSDKYLNFIQLMINYKIPASAYFKSIFKRVHQGKSPEKELFELKTSSKDFNNFVKYLLINKFDNYDFDSFSKNSLEDQFKIYLKQVQSKISILFFIGLFFPIGLCFLILFQVINAIFLLFFIPFFLIALNLLFNRFIKNQSYLIGLLNDYTGLERRKFEEFIIFLRNFAANLKSNISPEKALIESYNQNKNTFSVLKIPLKNQTSYLLNFSHSFSEVIEILKSELKSWRYSIILDALKNFINKNAYFSSNKIREILNILQKHQKFENRLEIIMKGEKFKIFFFIILLPIITGAISGFFPFFRLIANNLDLTGNVANLFFENPPNLYNIGIILFILISSISITSNYFLKLIYHIRRFPIIIGSSLLFILIFLISFINTANFF